MNTVIIDDNNSFLLSLEGKGYKVILTANKDFSAISNELKNLDEVEKVLINISLLFNTTKRMDYNGIELMSRLMFEVPIRSWTLLTFEKPNNVIKRNNAKILSKLKNVKLLEYIKLLNEIVNNGKV